MAIAFNLEFIKRKQVRTFTAPYAMMATKDRKRLNWGMTYLAGRRVTAVTQFSDAFLPTSLATTRGMCIVEVTKQRLRSWSNTFKLRRSRHKIQLHLLTFCSLTASYKPCTKSQLPTLERRHGSTCNDLHCKDII